LKSERDNPSTTLRVSAAPLLLLIRSSIRSAPQDPLLPARALCAERAEDGARHGQVVRRATSVSREIAPLPSNAGGAQLGGA